MAQPAALKLPPMLIAGFAACAPMHMPEAGRRNVAVDPSAVHELFVGTGRADLTPPPGVATFGHGPDAHVTVGLWTRIYCRVFVLETVRGAPLALVPCDLPAPELLLHRKIAQLVRESLGGDVLPPSRIMMTATHTHAGPAHYFQGSYSGILSSRAPGFDRAVLDFLAQRIADAVIRAYHARRPAAARWVHGCEGRLTRNRSLEPYRANGGDPPLHGCDRSEVASEGIDPALDVLQFDEAAAGGPRKPIGWIAFFAMHPTVLPNTNRLIGADIFGVASRQLEASMRRLRAAAGACGDGCDSVSDGPLAAIVNTNEGDSVPIWSRGDRDEAVEIGTKLTNAIERLALGTGTRFARSFAVDSRYTEVFLPRAPLASGGALCTGELGAGSGHGGSDHPTSLDALISPGSDIDVSNPGDCKAPKARLLGLAQPLLIGTSDERFPDYVPIAQARLGDTFVTYVPAEMTYAGGAAVNGAVLAATSSAVPGAHAIVGGLANAYIQYVATAKEYSLQHYEGGSTLYGPKTAALFAEKAAALSRRLLDSADPAADIAGAFDYRLAPQRDRFPRPRGDAKDKKAIGVCRLRQKAAFAACFVWQDSSPGDVPLTASRWLKLTTADGAPLVADGQPGAGIDDSGLAFETRVRKHENGVWLWSTVFTPDANEISALRSAGKVTLRGGSVASAPFTADELRDCTVEVAASCAESGEWARAPRWP